MGMYVELTARALQTRERHTDRSVRTVQDSGCWRRRRAVGVQGALGIQLICDKMAIPTSPATGKGLDGNRSGG